jgi:hypothetical protein
MEQLACCRNYIRIKGGAAMMRFDAKKHLGDRRPAHGMFADLPFTIKQAKKDWKLQQRAHHGSVVQSVGELEED